jgi:hypothetical protein
MYNDGDRTYPRGKLGVNVIIHLLKCRRAQSCAKALNLGVGDIVPGLSQLRQLRIDQGRSTSPQDFPAGETRLQLLNNRLGLLVYVLYRSDAGRGILL